MSRWIDADVFVRSVVKSGLGAEFINSVTALIIDTPTIDLVRCEECKYSDWYKCIDGEWRCYCTEHGSSGHEADDFCSYGDREENE